MPDQDLEGVKSGVSPFLVISSKWGPWVLFGGIISFFLLVKSYSLHWEVGDENVYFYMAWATADHGAWPYADYFFAHPPLHLMPGILLFGLVGINPLSVRLIPVAATVVGALFLFLLSKRSLGRLAAVFAVFFYLTNYSLLRASSHWTGVNLTVMWMVLGLWALMGKKPAWSGVFFALGVCTGNYGLPGAVMGGGLAFLESRRSGVRFLLGFLSPWLVVQILGLIIGGGDYLDAVYRYHFNKPDKPGSSKHILFKEFTNNLALYLGALLGALWTFLGRWFEKPIPPGNSPKEVGKEQTGKIKRRRGTVVLPEKPMVVRVWVWFQASLWGCGTTGLARIGVLWALGYLLFIFWLPRVFDFYFLLLFPGMALAAAYSADCLIRHAWNLSRSFKTRDQRWWKATSILGVILVAIVIGYLVRVPVQRQLLPNYVRTSDTPMNWADAPLPDFVNGIFRGCCWDDVAKAQREYGTLQEVLYHESRYFQKVDELADFVRNNSSPQQTIFGDSSTAGIVALVAGRRLEKDFADTNTMRFTSKMITVKKTIELIDTPQLAFVLVSATPRRSRDGRSWFDYNMFASLPEFRRWLDEKFSVAFSVQDPYKGWFLLLRKKDATL